MVALTEGAFQGGAAAPRACRQFRAWLWGLVRLYFGDLLFLRQWNSLGPMDLHHEILEVGYLGYLGTGRGWTPARNCSPVAIGVFSLLIDLPGT